MGSDHADELQSTQDSSGKVASKTASYDIPLVELKLQNVTYAPITSKADAMGTLSSAAHRTTVLRNISTTIDPFKLTAWMGPSGSGKTSLISVAADLIKQGDLDKDSVIFVNGEKGKPPKRLVGVVWQDDLLLSNLTVQENVYYAARLKSSEKTSNDEVHNLVQETLEELGLKHVRESLVGNPIARVRGISGGERKRVAVAAEMVIHPSLLLLDEPTSGLDATTAQSLINTLKDLALRGHSIAVVIHQPRTTIYNSFDHLLLLSKGNMIYDGHPCKARAVLESCPGTTKLPPETGIADWIMDIVRDDEQRKDLSALAEHWKRNEQDVHSATPMGAEFHRTKSNKKMSTLVELNSTPKFSTGFFTQLKLLTRRTFKQQRGERLTVVAIIFQLAYLCFTAMFWWRLPNTTNWVFPRNSLYFFMIIAQAFGIVTSSVTVFQQERTLLRRERAKKMYGVASYFIAKTASDMTNNVVLPVVYGCVVYWAAALRPDFIAFLKFTLAYYLTLSTAQSMGLLFSIALPTIQLALIFAAPITLVFIIMGGFYIPFEDMNPGVKWMSWLSFARYGYSALIVNEYEGRDIPCALEEDISISVGNSGACPLPGGQVIASLGIVGVTESYWFNISIVIALQVMFRFGAYVLLRRSK